MTTLTSPPRHAFDLLGGRLCLDFVNTVSGKRDVAPVERLVAYADLVSWAEQVGVLGPAEARRLEAVVSRSEERARRTLARALELREALYRVFLAVSTDEQAAERDVQLLNRHLTEALGHQRLVAEGAAFRLGWEDPAEHLDAPLWPVLRSAAELLTSPEARARVRVCEMTFEDGCGWLFLDETKNRTRRWCSMKDCGNRAKARRHYARQKGREAGRSGD